MKKTLSYSLLMAAAMLVCSCDPPYTPSNQEVFLGQTDVCMVAGQKEYIGGGLTPVQSSFNPSKNLYRGGNIEHSTDEATGCQVELVNEYYVLKLETSPGEVGTKVKGSVYLKHKTLPNSFRTYGTSEKPVEFEVLKSEDCKLWLWSPDIKIGVVIRCGIQDRS